MRLFCFDLIIVAFAFFPGSAWPCFFAVLILGAEQHDRRELILCLHLLALHRSSFFSRSASCLSALLQSHVQVVSDSAYPTVASMVKVVEEF